MEENSTSSGYFSNVTSFQSSTVTSDLKISTENPSSEQTTWDDATWILTSAFIIFTMQSGFGLLESGCVSSKNEVNIMAKNVADVIFGGISYWMLGFGFSFGDGSGTNGFCGIGKFFIDPDDSIMGEEFSRFVFQSSFATTATTIVSGAIAERTKYLAYIIFSFFNTFVFCFPAHWVWSDHGWLKKMGVVDVAGDGPVHIVGGATSLVATIMIKPRAKRFTDEDDHQMGSPTGALLGLFILWWGWLAFNCGSTYGISNGRWKMAARAAATTLMSASMGGVMGFAGSFIFNKRKFYISNIINGVLGGLVSITACCAVTGIWEALVIGSVGGALVLMADALLVKLHIDDPVSAIPVHGVGGIWGLIGAGLFTHKDTVTRHFSSYHGLVRGGGFYLLGVQVLAIVSIAVWSMVTSGLILKVIDLTLGLRLSPEEEEAGSDLVEHNIRRIVIVKCETLSPNDVNDNDSQYSNRSFNSKRAEAVLSAALANLTRNGTAHQDSEDNLDVESATIEQTPQTPETPSVTEMNGTSNGSAFLSFFTKRKGNKQKNNNNPTSPKVRRLNIRNQLRNPVFSSTSACNDVQLTNIQRKSSVTTTASGVCMLSYSSRDDLASVSTVEET